MGGLLIIGSIYLVLSFFFGWRLAGKGRHSNRYAAERDIKSWRLIKELAALIVLFITLLVLLGTGGWFSTVLMLGVPVWAGLLVGFVWGRPDGSRRRDRLAADPVVDGPAKRRGAV